METKALYFPDKSFIVQTDNDLIDKIIYFRKEAIQLSSKELTDTQFTRTNLRISVHCKLN